MERANPSGILPLQRAHRSLKSRLVLEDSALSASKLGPQGVPRPFERKKSGLTETPFQNSLFRGKDQIKEQNKNPSRTKLKRIH